MGEPINQNEARDTSVDLSQRGLDVRILAPLFRALVSCHCPTLIMRQPRLTTSVQDKLELLSQECQVVLEELLKAGIVPQGFQEVLFAVSRTLTGLTPGGIPFIVTSFGVQQVSLEERKDILRALGVEAPSNKLAKSIRLGQSSGIALESLGLYQGFVGPFYIPSIPLKRIFIDRSLNTDESFYVVADFAAGGVDSLLVPFDFVLKVMQAFEQIVRVGNTIVVPSPDVVIF
jgi:hypothetical protein